jgi:hypothetical protein
MMIPARGFIEWADFAAGCGLERIERRETYYR